MLIKIRMIQFISLVSLLALLQSCSMTTRVTAYPIVIKQTSLIERNLTDQQIKDKLEVAYFNWHNTPYGYGRQQPGIAADCSGFTQSVFKNQLAIDLPRTTAQQINLGQKNRHRSGKSR